jgi:hypothetical protein
MLEYMVELYAFGDVTPSDCLPDFYATREDAERAAKEFAKIDKRISAWKIIEIDDF